MVDFDAVAIFAKSHIMKKLLLLVTGALIASVSYSQITDTTLILGITLETAPAFANYNKCGYSKDIEIPYNNVVVIIGVDACSIPSRRYFRVRYNQNFYYIESKYVKTHKEYSYDSLIAVPESAFKPLLERSSIYDDFLSEENDKKYVKYLNSKAAHPVLLLNWGPYNESEYTDGTGMNFEFFNNSKKTIKYIKVNMQAYNRVKDKVGSVKTVRVVGPLNSYNHSSVSFEYVWFTDLVEEVKITSLIITFMDGTTKTETNIKAIDAPEEVIIWLKQ